MSDNGDVRDILAEWHALAFSENGRKYLLDYAATLLRVLSDPSHPAREQKSVLESARATAAMLDDIRRKWEDGDVLHFEDALHLHRPRRWNRKAVKRRAQYKYVAAHLVRDAIKAGAKTPDVFQLIYESGRLPENISRSQIEKWYYEQRREAPELYDASHD